MKVSVIIPCFKQAVFLKECIDSIKNQTHSDWEAIIINDGSPDETDIIAKELKRSDQRIRYIVQENQGVSAARNTGLRLATGTYIQFLDADDIIEPNKFKHQIRILQENCDIGVVYGESKYFFNDDPKRIEFNNAFFGENRDEDWVAARSNTKEPALKRLFRNNLTTVCAPLFKRDVQTTNINFDESITAQEDWLFWNRLAAAGLDFRYVPSPKTACLIRVHSKSATQNQRMMQRGLVELRCKQLKFSVEEADRVFLQEQLITHSRELLQDDLARIYRKLNQGTLRFSEAQVWAIFLAARKRRIARAFASASTVLLPWRLRVVARALIK